MASEVAFDVRAAALILRERNGKCELLAQSFAADPSIPWRFPGGGVENDESIEAGLLREIREEAGIETLQFVRKLGIQRHYKPYLSRYIERHDLLFYAKVELPNFWEHIVNGEGKDAGEVFYFQWIGLDDIYRIDVELQKFLDVSHLPEFFR